MTHTKELHEELTAFRRGEIDRDRLASRIYLTILERPKQYKLNKWSPERYGDFCSWLYPRILRCIDRYRDTGSSFDAYIYALVHWSAKEYSIREAEHYYVEKAVWAQKGLELEEAASDVGATYTARPLPAIANPTLRKRLLMLTLKCAPQVSDRMAERIARSIGMEGAELRFMIKVLREGLEQNIERRDELLVRIGLQYYRGLSIQNRYRNTPAHCVRKEKLLRMQERSDKKIRSMRERLKSINIQASNRDVALVMGIPKGTVDSAIATIKKSGSIPYSTVPAKR